MDTIYIKDLEVFANHGVYPEENKLGQKFVISADLSVDVRMAGLTDELEYSVNYGEVSHTIQDFLQNIPLSDRSGGRGAGSGAVLQISADPGTSPGDPETVGSGRTAAQDSLCGDQKKQTYRLYRTWLQYGR